MKKPGSMGGFTLVEIMIAIVIGLFLTAGMIQMYVANKQAYRFNEALARIQENGRLALALLAKDIRMATFFGCAGGSNVTSRIDTTSEPPYKPLVHDFTVGIEGTDNAAGDSITVRRASSIGLTVQGHSGPNASDPVLVPGTKTYVDGLIGDITNSVAKIALVTDCEDGDIFQVIDTGAGSPTQVVFIGTPQETANGTTPGNDGTGLTKVYDQSASFYTLRAATYSIAAGTNGDPALWVTANGNLSELAEGVENMQIIYGEDLAPFDGTANRYVTATNVTTWDNVVSVRVSLLLASADTGLTTDNPQSYDLDQDGTDDAACPTGRICQTMSTTVTIRNRTP